MHKSSPVSVFGAAELAQLSAVPAFAGKARNQEFDLRRRLSRWCLRTAWPRDPPGFADRMQLMMHTSDFPTPLDARLAKLLWLATYAIVLAGR